jgi:glycosyltransferase involved in cell wall biosynthesis
MKVLLFDGDVSYPATSGKRLRTLNLMLKLADRHDITYLGRLTGDKSTDPEAEEFLRDHGIEPILVHAPLPMKSGPGFAARLVRNLFETWPYSVASHQSELLRQTVARLHGERRFDVQQIEWTGYLPMVPAGVPRVSIAHNVETVIWQRSAETAANPLKRAFLVMQARKMEAFERWAVRAGERLVAVSEEDARIFRTRFGAERVDVVDNGVDNDFFADVTGSRDPFTVLFLGALDWRPNQDAIDILLGRIFPEVRRQEPRARLMIVGRNPSASLRSRTFAMDGVELHADVADVRPFLGRAGLMAVPLRIGGGSRLKILEALASNVPVIASRVGAEGLHLTPGTHFVESDEDAMAAAIVSAMRNPEPIRTMTEAGRTLVREQYDWSALARKLEAVWDSSVGWVSRPVLASSLPQMEPLTTTGRGGTGQETHPTGATP